MPIPIPNLNQLQISQPQPATMKLQGMEYQRRREETDLRKDYMRLATDKFTQQIMEQERNFGAGKAEWEFEKTIKAILGKIIKKLQAQISQAQLVFVWQGKKSLHCSSLNYNRPLPGCME